MSTHLPLGKKPHVHDSRDLLLARYVAELPPLPVGPLGHGKVIDANSWGTLGNDRVGDCVFAGGAHESMLWNTEWQRPVSFTDESVLSDYSAVTGYNPADPNSDQGTDMRTAMLYRQSTGLLDASGQRHKIRAFTALAAGDLNQIKTSIYLFSVASVGIQFPTTAMDQFSQGQPWSVVTGASIEGGHYVPVVYFDPDTGLFYCVTWGKLQPVEPAFLATYMDEGYAPIAPEAEQDGKTPEGFDDAQLDADLQALAGT